VVSPIKSNFLDAMTEVSFSI